jgi:hypothetical protein
MLEELRLVETPSSVSDTWSLWLWLRYQNHFNTFEFPYRRVFEEGATV